MAQPEDNRAPLAPEETTIDALAGDWTITQLRRGHRFGTDDVLTAWLGLRLRPRARRVLDLGAGIGSVGLVTLHGLPSDSTLVMVEAQELSHGLALQTIARNGLGGRVHPRLGDLRDPASVPDPGTYDLVTGSPPYIPVGKGVISPHPQRAHARIELRGDVFDYCRAAARALAPEAAFAFCHAAGDPRPERAVAEAGLRLTHRIDIFFREGRDPTIALFAAVPLTSTAAVATDLPRALVIRAADGGFSPPYRDIRRFLGAPEVR